MECKKPIGKLLNDASRKIRRKIDKEVAKFELTSVQGRILAFVFHKSKERDIFQKDIEEEFNIRRSSVSNAIQLLEKHEFIKRESVAEDARLKKIIITDKGLEVQNEAFKCIDKMENEIKSEFTEEETKLLVDFLSRINNKFND